MNNTEYTNATNGQQVVRYTTNHDVNGFDGTPLALFGGRKGSMAAFVVTACMKGVPMVYNGQEVGTPFRSGSAAMRRGLLSSFSNADIVAFTKELAGEKVLVLSNLRNSVITFPFPVALQNSTWTDAMTGKNIHLTKEVVLQPYSYMIAKQ